ncbi:MAG TPA: hypothetical protein VMO00_06095, partial [Methylomirabilota bacterium]|nr:hypothetical protein [Methylomirabilota bacterium]
AYVGHIDPPYGTSIVDVHDPKHPKLVSQLEVPEGIHSHKVRVSDNVMLVNYERYQTKEKPPAGLKVFDISNREKPREIAFFKTERGVHRFTFDGRYAYLSPDLEGYLGNIVMILDLKDPSHPEEVGRWWMPGQWIAGGEQPTWEGRDHRCHHPIRRGDRLYVSYWHGGFVILNISDMSHPKFVSGLSWNPPYPAPTHTTLPIPWKLMDRDILVVADEDAQKRAPLPPAFLWIVDITEETHPVPISTHVLPPSPNSDPEFKVGAHQPAEQVYDNILYVTWFSGGLRAVDISNPYSPKEVGYYVPQPGKGQKTVKSNDVFRSEGGLLYLMDRYDGLEILESHV